MINVRKEIYQVENGYGYKIYINEKLTILQPYYPCLSGTNPMTYEIANNLAEIIKVRIEQGQSFGIKKEIVEKIKNKEISIEEAISSM